MLACGHGFSPTANLKNQARGVYEAFADARNATNGFYLDNINVPSGQDQREKSKRICKATKAYLTSERKVGVKKPTTRYSATE